MQLVMSLRVLVKLVTKLQPVALNQRQVECVGQIMHPAPEGQRTYKGHRSGSLRILPFMR